jgi:hypothetical protein
VSTPSLEVWDAVRSGSGRQEHDGEALFGLLSRYREDDFVVLKVGAGRGTRRVVWSPNGEFVAQVCT